MATPDTVLAAVAAAYDESATLAGKQTIADKGTAYSVAMTALTAAIAERDKAIAAAAALQAKIDKARSDLV